MKTFLLTLLTACASGAPVSSPPPLSGDAPPVIPPGEHHVALGDDLTGPFTNRLAAETSPYLIQHGHNPVDWYPWGEEAFAAAAARDVPIFLSIGYAACHWCHVMEEETFTDPVVAAFLNANFVAIKVDREERPDVDGVYMDAVSALNHGNGGWPANLWLTPDKRPFYAGTYFPPQGGRGRPGFRDVLEGVSHAWATERAGLLEDAGNLEGRLARYAVVTPAPETPDLAVAHAALAALVSSWDAETKGWGARKFPMTPRLTALLALGVEGGDPAALRVVAETLDAMDRGGVHDQVGGGFHRYAVDARWQVPHFEKMLYDNGQLLGLYAAASVATDSARFADVAEDIATWMARELRAPDGSFYSSLDADTAGEEGTTYTWTPDQARAALGDDAAAFLATYRVTPAGNFDGGATVLTRPAGDPVSDDVLARALAARSHRDQPRVDDKRVVSYNGLAIGGLATAGRLLHRADWVTLAADAATAVLSHRHPDGAMPRTLETTSPPGVLDDYVYLASGLLDLYEATGELRWLEAAADLAQEADTRLWDPALGAWFQSEDASLFVRKKELSDGPEPSPVGAAVAVHLRLAAYGAAEARADRVDDALRAASSMLTRSPGGAPTLAQDRIVFETPAMSFVVSANTADEAAPYVALWSERWRPGAVIGVVTAADRDAAEAFGSLSGKTPADAGPRAYLCFNGACRQPVETVDDARAVLATARQARTPHP